MCRGQRSLTRNTAQDNDSQQNVWPELQEDPDCHTGRPEAKTLSTEKPDENTISTKPQLQLCVCQSHETTLDKLKVSLKAQCLVENQIISAKSHIQLRIT